MIPLHCREILIRVRHHYRDWGAKAAGQSPWSVTRMGGFLQSPQLNALPWCCSTFPGIIAPGEMSQRRAEAFVPELRERWEKECGEFNKADLPLISDFFGFRTMFPYLFMERTGKLHDVSLSKKGYPDIIPLTFQGTGQ